MITERLIFAGLGLVGGFLAGFVAGHWKGVKDTQSALEGLQKDNAGLREDIREMKAEYEEKLDDLNRTVNRKVMDAFPNVSSVFNKADENTEQDRTSIDASPHFISEEDFRILEKDEDYNRAVLKYYKSGGLFTDDRDIPIRLPWDLIGDCDVDGEEGANCFVLNEADKTIVQIELYE